MKYLIAVMLLSSCTEYKSVCSQTKQAEWLLRCYDKFAQQAHEIEAYTVQMISVQCKSQSKELFCRKTRVKK